MCLEFSYVSNPLIRQVYDAYSFGLVPEIGAAVANDRDAYQYLVESIRKFPRQEECVLRRAPSRAAACLVCARGVLIFII